MTEQAASIWTRAQEIIKKDLDNEQTFNIWFGPIKFASLSEISIVLEVPNKFFKGWLVDRYMKLLASGVQRAFGKELKIDFVFSEPDEDAALQKDRRDGQRGQAKPGFWPFGRPSQAVAKEIGLTARYTFDSFVVGPSNRF